MSIVQHLLVEEYGAFLRKHSERLQVIKDDHVLVQAPLIHLETVTIANSGVALSAEVVRECTERGIPIFFLSGLGKPYASLYSAGLTGTIATRRAQLAAYDGEAGRKLVFQIVMGKLQNQANLLKYFAKYRKDTDTGLYEELRCCAAEVLDERIRLEQLREELSGQGVVTTASDIREILMGIEGRAAERYWRAVERLLPPEYEFFGRIGRGATDPMNSALNYGYGILYGACERCLVLAGLDPYGGFLHADRPGKPSLTLDFIEEYRSLAVDRTVIGLANKHVTFAQDDRKMLTADTRKVLAEKIRERMEGELNYEGKRHSLKNVMQKQARHLATFLRGERSEYLPLTFEW